MSTSQQGRIVLGMGPLAALTLSFVTMRPLGVSLILFVCPGEG